MKYTKGPWEADGNGVFEKGKPNQVIAIAHDPDDGHHLNDISKANAQLMAASPDMYEALNAIKEWYDKGEELCTNDPQFELLLNALRKAEGRTD